MTSPNLFASVRASVLFVVVAMSVFACAHWPRVSGDGPRFGPASAAAIESLRSEAGVPGMAVVIATRAGIAWSRGFGVADVATGAAATDRTVFQAASLGKPIFAYAVLRLASQGKFDIDRPVASYWRNPELSGDPRNSEVTAAMLLSHTAGLPNVRDGSVLTFDNDPGQGFEYSSEGFLYLQKVVEHTFGMSADDLVRKYVFDPLGMKDTSYLWRDEFADRAATGTDGRGNPVPRDKPAVANVSGGLQTTARDYGKFLVAMLNGWGLSRDIRDRMLSPAVVVWNLPKSSSRPAHEQLAWGTGVGLQIVDGEGESFWQWGDLTFFRAFMEGYPDTGVAVAFLTNSVNGLAVTRALLDATVGGTKPAIQWLGYDQIAPSSKPGGGK